MRNDNIIQTMNRTISVSHACANYHGITRTVEDGYNEHFGMRQKVRYNGQSSLFRSLPVVKVSLEKFVISVKVRYIGVRYIRPQL